MASAPHHRLIDECAKATLGPMGCVQKGRSRIWLDDHGWWLGVVEFLPGRWEKGSGLNVGACWLWTPKDYLSFDDGYRIEEFKEFKGDEQFQVVAKGLAERAKAEVAALRERFHSIASTARWLYSKPKRPEDIWAHIHVAVAAGLNRDIAIARRHFQRAIDIQERDLDWVRALKQRAAKLLGVKEDQSAFREAEGADIETARQLLD